ncbi:hypothetical protein DEIPH_ctg079orf0005 [Deinococcus phoenicis]|uniref:Uncharacterized protein n=1 Tax=Deinococcus phoenicis TaxID=1476583 RepID=A0A016QKX8_9DEIO|nr:helix-hairpin-helix domain-containing protein [Deinococcus phoenicis]EYB66626.1 hypothetical protein DEIPH_ctg079orf0005 [Deinococcus phoenicis]
MGEAKRRKQLGLMPTVHPFEAELDAGGQVTLTHGPADAALREQIVAALRETQPTGDAWPRAYRRAAIMAGLPEKLLRTREDLEAIPVPPLRRLTGELVFNLDPRTLRGDALRAVRDYLPLEGGAVLHLRRQETSQDGGRWESLPEPEHPLSGIQYLMQHPLAREQGALVARYDAEHWREGRIDFEPEPPAEQLEELEGIVRRWHGGTPEEWAERHFETLDLPEEEDDDARVPTARRVRLELRESVPLASLVNLAFTTLGEQEVHISLDHRFYTLDGETWHAYGNPDAQLEEGGGELGEFLADMLDVETLPVTVWADGRLEWPGGGVPEEHAERVRADLLRATGAGNPGAWAAFTEGVLRDMFTPDTPALEDLDALPVPQAMRIDIPVDALTDPDPLAQTFIESEVSFDGETWRDLYDDLPEELVLRLPQN